MNREFKHENNEFNKKLSKMTEKELNDLIDDLEFELMIIDDKIRKYGMSVYAEKNVRNRKRVKRDLARAKTELRKRGLENE